MNDSLHDAGRLPSPAIGSAEVRPTLTRSERPSLAVALSFLWPGLGQLYLGQRRRAAIYALPWALLLLVGLVAVAINGPAILVWLLVPSVTLLAIALIALHGVWSVVSLLDAAGRRRPTGERLAPAFLLAVALGIGLATVHFAAGFTMQSVAQAGAEIFGVDQPAGDTDLDVALGGGMLAAPPGGPIRCPAPRASGDPDYGEAPSMAPGATAEPGPTVEPGVPSTSEEPDQVPPSLPCRTSTPDATTAPGASTDPGEVITDHIGNLPQHGPINVLFIGIDSGLDRLHALTDTLFVASYDQDTKKLTMISIPRDTGRTPLYIGGTFRPKFNEFLGYAARHPDLFPEGGIKALMNEVGYVLGIDVHFYAATNLEGFPDLVDLVGGVTITNPTRIWLDSGEWLDPGTYEMDGTKALLYSRSRHGPGNNDWERARRQQQVVRAIAQKMASPAVIPRLPGLIDRMAELARTNAKPSQLPALLPILIGAATADAEHIVLQPSEYARRLDPSTTGGLYMTQLRMRVLAEMSRRVFGPYSRYTKASSTRAE